MRFISPMLHTIIGLIVGVVLLFAAQLFHFTENIVAMNVAFYTGIVIIVSELITVSPLSPIKAVPMRIHIFIDYLVGLFLAFSPWLFGFSNIAPYTWVPHLIIGFLVIGYALFTRPEVEIAKTASPVS